MATAGGMIVMALACGFVIGMAVFGAMTASSWLTELIWRGYLEDASAALPAFPLVVCGVGGAVIGIWTALTHDTVRPLHEVMATFKKTGSYSVRPLHSVVSFLLPLVAGGSIGFEAGLTGLIVSGCCWIRDQLKGAGLRVAGLADVTVAASLSAILGAPLAGIVAGVESSGASVNELMEEPGPDGVNMRRGAKAVLYTAAAFGALAGARVLGSLTGGTSGMPRMEAIAAQGPDLMWAVVALAAAYALTWVYHLANAGFSRLAKAMGDAPAMVVARPTIAGLALGAVAMTLPYVLFPGEEQAHVLMANWGAWTAVALVGTGVLKAAATPLCINMGWVGGNFFPCIFAGMATGYGLAALTGADPMLMVTVCVAAFLAGVLRAPVITVAILILVFPLTSVPWVGVAAVLGAALPLPAALVAKE